MIMELDILWKRLQKIVDDRIEILVIAIWKRENEKVYKDAFKKDYLK